MLTAQRILDLWSGLWGPPSDSKLIACHDVQHVFCVRFFGLTRPNRFHSLPSKGGDAVLYLLEEVWGPIGDAWAPEGDCSWADAEGDDWAQRRTLSLRHAGF